VERTGGVPLFVEELTRAMLESGNMRLSERQIPVTLHDSLMARLDRLGPVKEVLQVGAAIGNEFSYQLLHAVHPIREEQLQEALGRLADAELLIVRGISPAATYQFRHALVRDAAYEALLKSRRRELHRGIAQGLEQSTATMFAPELLAHHYTEAGLTAEAMRQWRKAGHSAIKQSAYVEATAHLNRGLEIAQTMPETPERMFEELQMQVEITGPITAIQGYSAPALDKACSRALQLSRQLRLDSRQLLSVLARLYGVYSNREELKKSSDLAEQMLQIAENIYEPLWLVWAHYCVGHTLMLRGNFEAARLHTEQCLANYDFARRRNYGWIWDPGATGLARLAHIVHLLGYPDQAHHRAAEALAHARTLSQPFTLAWVLNSIASFYALRTHEFELAERLWAEEVDICEKQHFSWLLASGIAGQGWAMVERGLGEEGISRMRQAARTLPADQPVRERRNFGIQMGYAFKTAKRSTEGLAIVADVLQMIAGTGDVLNEADLYFLKGEMQLMVDSGNESEPESCFRYAIEVARGQAARSSELRVTTSLARLLRDTGRRDEARTMLAEIYNWFTEGFDTADLKEAKALLTNLAV
jgi:predicted ATPase